MFDIASGGEELSALLIAGWHRMQPLLSASQTTISLSLSKASMSILPLAAIAEVVGWSPEV
jgi:hypothetical protein